MDNEDPVFLCGALRTGTTVLGLMLRYHPEIIAPGEFDFLFDNLDDAGNFPDTQSYLNQLTTNRIFNAHQLNVDAGSSFEENIYSFISQLGNQGKLLSLNVHRNFNRIPFLFPKARYIHLMRDARDVARSSIGMGWSGNVFYGVDHWINTELSWDKLKPNLDKTQYIEVRFEELITRPEEVLERICNFLNLSFSEKMLDYADNTTYSKPDVSLTRQWERKQSRREVQLVEYKAGDMILSQGYELSGYAKIKPGIVERFVLLIQNKIFRFKYSVRHFGLKLYFLEKLTRIPVLKKWRPYCLLEMNKLKLKLIK